MYSIPKKQIFTDSLQSSLGRSKSPTRKDRDQEDYLMENDENQSDEINGGGRRARKAVNYALPNLRE